MQAERICYKKFMRISQESDLGVGPEYRRNMLVLL